MNAVLPAAAVEPFVRECLGCGCPAAVFERIEMDIRELDDVRYQRWLVGGRLLVYLLSAADPDRLSGQLDRLLRAGTTERDGVGCNRLRIVVPGRPDENLLRMLNERFEQQAGGDENVHLHFVPREALERYLGP